jgi:hypothetical protein
MRSKRQNPLHNFKQSAKAKESYLNMFPNGIEQFERNAAKVKAKKNYLKMFPNGLEQFERDALVSKATRVKKPHPKPIPRTINRTVKSTIQESIKGPIKKGTKPRPKIKNRTILNPVNSNSPLKLAGIHPNSPIAKSNKSIITLLDGILKPTLSERSRRKPIPKSIRRKPNIVNNLNR